MNLSDIKIYGSKIIFTDDLDLMKKVLNIYAKIVNIEKKSNYLSPRLVNVLSFYMLKGYSKETKVLIQKSLDINVTNLNQINAELTKKKCLVKDEYNFSTKHLSESLENLKLYFIKGEYSKIFMINFKKEDVT